MRDYILEFIAFVIIVGAAGVAGARNAPRHIDMADGVKAQTCSVTD